MSSNDENKVPETGNLSEEALDAIAGGAGPDANGNYICPYCREYALKPGADDLYHCSFCGKSFEYHF